ncbi:MAG: patatin-like phospholipase family protein [Defluviicoccus sp.]|nr:patatin-like phospholipase family protein [Defluviicoccus sp.]
MTNDVEFLHQDSFPSADLNPPDRRCPDPSPDRPFEIGIALAGAVAAGAYHGGVMDFLVEALDAWYGAKAREEDVPPHDVVLKVITGASGGGMTAALAAASLAREIPPVWDDPGTKSDNPFFDPWVNRISIWNLLGDRDLEGDRKLISILDSTVLREIAAGVLASTASLPLLEQPRGWLESRLPVQVTLANLRGVPYRSTLRGTTQQGYGISLHKDHARFALSLDEQASTFPDERPLDPSGRNDDEHWQMLMECALGSGAFPFFLAPRQIDMGRKAYRYRVVVCPDPKQPGYIAIAPRWDLMESHASDCSFAAVDGGTMNNEPLDLARHVLAGRFGRNPRRGDEAIRATVLVDPFPELSDGPRTRAADLTPFKALPALANAWKMQSRGRIEDLALASEEDVYSRYLIAPDRGPQAVASRSNSNTQFHLAGGFLEGFGGFLSPAISVHDYLLGRHNAHIFLAEEFALPTEHPLFRKWTKDQRDRHAIGDNNETPRWLPVIPLVNTNGRDFLRESPPMPAWPNFDEPVQGEPFASGTELVLMLQDGAINRFNRIWPELLTGVRPDSRFTGPLFDAWTYPLRRTLRSRIRHAIEGIKKEIVDMGFTSA